MNYYNKKVFTFATLFKLFEERIRKRFFQSTAMSPSIEDFRNEFDLAALLGAIHAYALRMKPPFRSGMSVTAKNNLEGVMVLDNSRGPSSIRQGQSYTVQHCIFIPPKDDAGLGQWHIKLKEDKHPLQTWPAHHFRTKYAKRRNASACKA